MTWCKCVCQRLHNSIAPRLPPCGKCVPLLLSRFNFMSSWPFRLNQLPEELAEVLPPTDARFRPDVRLLEEGVYDQVTILSTNFPMYCLRRIILECLSVTSIANAMLV
jgi:hypothetical protein